MAPHILSDDLDAQKRDARAAALLARRGCDPARGVLLARHVVAAAIIPAGAIVGGFWPLPGEIDIRPLMEALHTAGQRLALPFTPRRGEPLTFHTWMPGDPLLPGRYGTVHPAGPAVQPDVLLVPLLAFDACGGRIGYGAGYYDRTLATLPGALTIGCAFAAQGFASVPMGVHDVRMTVIATENGVFTPGKG